MTALEELKEATKDSVTAKQRVLSELIGEPAETDESEFRNAALDVISEALTMYKVTVAQARVAESVEEVATLWHDTHAFYAGILSLWQGLAALIGESPRDELFAYCSQMIEKLERTTAEHYAFYA
jgi:hypothetical protein